MHLILDNSHVDVEESKEPDLSGKVVLRIIGVERLRLTPDEAVELASALLEISIYVREGVTPP